MTKARSMFVISTGRSISKSKKRVQPRLPFHITRHHPSQGTKQPAHVHICICTQNCIHIQNCICTRNCVCTLSERSTSLYCFHMKRAKFRSRDMAYLPFTVVGAHFDLPLILLSVHVINQIERLLVSGVISIHMNHGPEDHLFHSS